MSIKEDIKASKLTVLSVASRFSSGVMMLNDGDSRGSVVIDRTTHPASLHSNGPSIVA